MVLTAARGPVAVITGVATKLGTPDRMTSSMRNSGEALDWRKRILRLAVDGIVPVGAIFSQTDVPEPVGLE